MMIVVVLLSLVLLSSDAVPMIREQYPIVIDGEEGVLYEIPEYEDPELIEYELSAMGGSPVLSFLELPKNRPNRPRPTSTTSSDTKESGTTVSSEKILELSEIIQGLQALQSNIQNGGDSNPQNEFTKAISGFQKLESSLGTDIRQLFQSIEGSMSILKPIIKIGIMPLLSGKYRDADDVLPHLDIDSDAIFKMQLPIPVESKYSDAKVKSTMSPSELLVTEEQEDQKEDGVSIYKSKWTLISSS